MHEHTSVSNLTLANYRIKTKITILALNFD